MDFFSHLIIAILIARYILGGLDIVYFYYAAFMAILADLDVFLEIMPKFRNSKLLSHKGISHSIAGSIVISLVPSFIIFLVFQMNFIYLWLIGFIFYLIHVFFDFLTASKIPVFYPFSKRKFRFFIDRAVNPFLMIISISIIIISLLMGFINLNILSISLFPIFLIFYIGYFLYKFFTKLVLKVRLPKNSKYIPGVAPFTYFIYTYNNENSTLQYLLTKKYQFRNKKEKLIDSQIKKNSPQMELLYRSLDLTKNYSFFSKWNAIIPIISENESHFKITLLLGETYANNQAYSLTTIFKKDSEDLIDRFDGFREGL